MKKRTGDDWFPFWIDKWLLGSTRDELTVEQCAVWVDFLALSYKDDGYIRANAGMPYPIKRLAGLLNRSEELIQQTIDRCLDPQVNKLRLEPDGTLYVISHPEYELSGRHKRRLSEAHVRQNGHDVQKKDAKSRVDKNRVDKNRVDKPSYPKKHSDTDIQLTEFLVSKILANNPKSKIQKMTEKTKDGWIDECRKLREIDKRTPEEIKAVIDWCQDDEFEKTVVLSMPKLRKRFDNLWMKSQRGSRPARKEDPAKKAWIDKKDDEEEN